MVAAVPVAADAAGKVGEAASRFWGRIADGIVAIGKKPAVRMVSSPKEKSIQVGPFSQTKVRRTTRRTGTTDKIELKTWELPIVVGAAALGAAAFLKWTQTGQSYVEKARSSGTYQKASTAYGNAKGAMAITVNDHILTLNLPGGIHVPIGISP